MHCKIPVRCTVQFHWTMNCTVHCAMHCISTLVVNRQTACIADRAKLADVPLAVYIQYIALYFQRRIHKKIVRCTVRFTGHCTMHSQMWTHSHADLDAAQHDTVVKTCCSLYDALEMDNAVENALFDAIFDCWIMHVRRTLRCTDQCTVRCTAVMSNHWAAGLTRAQSWPF